MAFNTASFLAGVGSVVVVLSTGFAGGYFVASPDHAPPPNRLERVAQDTADKTTPDTKTSDTKTADATPAPAAAPQANPEATAAVTPAQADPAPASTAQSSAPPAPAPTQQASTEQSPTPTQQAAAKTEQQPAPAEQTTAQATSGKADKERSRIAEAKSASKKRWEARKLAEEQRRQRELEVAAGAVRHIIHDRDGDEIIVRDATPPDVVEVDRAEPPEPDARPFGFFGR